MIIDSEHLIVDLRKNIEQNAIYKHIYEKLKIEEIIRRQPSVNKPSKSLPADSSKTQQAEWLDDLSYGWDNFGRIKIKNAIYCSNCRKMLHEFPKTKFCPECGARMINHD